MICPLPARDGASTPMPMPISPPCRCPPRPGRPKVQAHRRNWAQPWPGCTNSGKVSSCRRSNRSWLVGRPLIWRRPPCLPWWSTWTLSLSPVSGYGISTFSSGSPPTLRSVSLKSFTAKSSAARMLLRQAQHQRQAQCKHRRLTLIGCSKALRTRRSKPPMRCGH